MDLTQILEQIPHDVVTQNAELIPQLAKKKAELTMAEETIRRQQQQIQEMGQQVGHQMCGATDSLCISVCVCMYYVCMCLQMCMQVYCADCSWLRKMS